VKIKSVCKKCICLAICKSIIRDKEPFDAWIILALKCKEFRYRSRRNELISIKEFKGI